MYISPEEFSQKHCKLKLLKKNASPNTSLYRSRDSKLVKKIKFQNEDDFRQWILCLEFEIQRQNDQHKIFPQHVLEILDHSYEKNDEKIKFYMTYNYEFRTDKIKNILDEKENPIMKTLKILEIAMMIKNSGICHNNIKPSNLIVFQSDQRKDYDILLTDFGSTRTHYRNYEFKEENKEWQNNHLFYQCREYLLYKDKPDKFAGFINKIEPDIWALGIIILQLFYHDQTSLTKNLTQYYGVNKSIISNKIVQLRTKYIVIADALTSLLLEPKYNIEQIYQKILEKCYSKRSYTPHFMKCQLQQINVSELQCTSILRNIKEDSRQFIFREKKNLIKTKFNIPLSETNDQISFQTFSRQGSKRGLMAVIANKDSPLKQSNISISRNQQEDDQLITNDDNEYKQSDNQQGEKLVIMPSQIEQLISDRKEDYSQQQIIAQKEIQEESINQGQVQVKVDQADSDQKYLISNNQFEQYCFQVQQEYLEKLFEISFSSNLEKQIEYLSALNTILENQYQNADFKIFDNSLCEEEHDRFAQFMEEFGEMNVPLKWIHYMKKFQLQAQQNNYQGFQLNKQWHGIGRMKKNQKIYQGIFHLGKLIWGSVFEMVEDNLFRKSTGTFTLDEINGEECEITWYKYSEKDMKFVFQQQYKGSVKNGVISGKGVINTEQWNYYGDLENESRQGYGSLRMIGEQQYLYVGEFHANQFSGFGIKYFDNGFQSGHYKNGKPIGEHIIKTEMNIQKVNQNQMCRLF